MSDQPLRSCRLKINRAITHFNQLNAEVETFLSRQPYKIVKKLDPVSGESEFKLHMAEKIPAEWSSLLGDCIHNLRSALDALAYVLVDRGVEPPRAIPNSQ